jgi:pimeloyl-ACP methyl ester carboxylesterase
MTRSEELRFRAGDRSLAGTLTLPDGDGRWPWAVLLPSWLPRGRDGDWDRERHPGWFAPIDGGGGGGGDGDGGLLRRLSDALAARGVASLRYDPRGCGASEGDWIATDLFTRIDDARDAIGAMRSRPELDLRRTALVGHGEGATIALSVAIGDPAVGAIGLVGAPARSGRTLLRRGGAERAGNGADRAHPIVAALDRSAEELLERVARRERSMRLRVGEETVELALAGWEQAVHTPTLALATMLHRPTVLAHGEVDAWAALDEARLLEATLSEGGTAPIVHVAPGAGHDLSGAEPTLTAFVDDLVARMQPRDLPPVLVAIEEMHGEIRGPSR